MLVDRRRGRSGIEVAVAVAQDLGRVHLCVRGGHAPSPVDEDELVGIDVEMCQCGVGVGVGRGCLEELALRPHGHILPGAHRQGAREQTRQSGEQDRAVRDPGRADAEHEREIAHQAVVGTEYCRPKGSGQAIPPSRSQSTDHFFVDALVGGHRVGSVCIAGVWRATLGALRQCKDEYGAEVPSQEPEHPRANSSSARLADLGSE